jgi:hypothetical protein
MARGVYRVRCGWPDQHSVLVDYGGVLMEVPEDRYRQRAYQPAFRKLPWKEDAAGQRRRSGAPARSH